MYQQQKRYTTPVYRISDFRLQKAVGEYMIVLRIEIYNLDLECHSASGNIPNCNMRQNNLSSKRCRQLRHSAWIVMDTWIHGSLGIHVVSLTLTLYVCHLYHQSD